MDKVLYERNVDLNSPKSRKSSKEEESANTAKLHEEKSEKLKKRKKRQSKCLQDQESKHRTSSIEDLAN